MASSLEELRLSLPLKIPTDPSWAPLAVQHLNQFLVDHASCERKAHAAALMMVNRFPEYPILQDQMIQLAREELDHFQQVVGLLRQRDLVIGADEVDPYVKKLLTLVRHPREEHVLDRLMVASVIEARSCERFCLFADELPKGPLKDFYTQFAHEESAHFPLILNTTKRYFEEATVYQRLDEFLTFEASVLPTIEIRPTVH